MRFPLILFLSLLLLPEASFAQLGGNACAATCVAAEQTIESVGGENYIITGKDKAAFEKKISALMVVSIDDVDRAKSIGRADKKIDILVRKSFFTDKGWKEYEAYVTRLKGRLVSNKNYTEAYGSFLRGTQNYAKWENYLGYSAIGYINYADRDVINPGAEMFEMNIAFLPQQPDAPENILIDTWRVKLFALLPEPSNTKDSVKPKK